jgi:hypothetical protein
MSNNKFEQGSVNPLLIASIVLGVLAAGFAGGFIWAYSNYVDQRDNTQAKVNTAVTEAKKAQAVEDEKILAERLKEPYNQLSGPEDLGKVTFSYPKTWSVYVARDGKVGSQYEAYLNPGSVPTVSMSQPFATRVQISGISYENTVRTFDGLVKRGDLRSSPISINGFTGVRLDGKFSPTRTGTAVLFKVRDKTLVVASDAESFKNDFENIVLKSLDFNP